MALNFTRPAQQPVQTTPASTEVMEVKPYDIAADHEGAGALA